MSQSQVFVIAFALLTVNVRQSGESSDDGERIHTVTDEVVREFSWDLDQPQSPRTGL